MSRSKETPCGLQAVGDRREAFRVLAHRASLPTEDVTARTALPAPSPSDRMLGNVMGATVLDTLLTDAEDDLRSLVVLDAEPVTWLLIDAPAADQDALVPEAVEQMTGTVAKTRDTGALARFANPAAAVGTWLTLAAWTDGTVRGAAVSGYCHRAELVGATLAELPDLLTEASPGELWVSFEIATAVDLNDERFSVERIDRGALVPASCKLTLR